MMKTNVFLSSVLGLFLGGLTSGSLAYADLTYKDWTMTEVAEDAALQVPVCHAYTNVSTSDALVGLSLKFPKNQSKAPVAFVKIDSSLKPIAVTIKTSSREMEPALALNLEGDSALDSYWYVPMDMDRLISRIAAANFLEVFVQVEGSETPIQISLSGSSKILQETKRCVGGELFSKEFFKDLNDRQAASYPVDGDVTPERAFGFFEGAYVNHAGAKEAQKNLDALRKENRGIIREETSALNEFNSAHEKLVSAQAALSANDQERAAYQKSIADNRTLLAQLAPQKQAAEQTLANKKAIYEPLRQEAKQYTSRINSAQSQINSAQGQIRSLKNDISNAKSEIEDLNREASNLESQVRRFESELSSAEFDLRRAESDYRNFDVQRETRRILENDFTYRNAQTEIRNEQRNLDNAQNQFQRAQSALRTCESDPSRNCTMERTEVNRWQSEADRTRSRIQNLEMRIRNAEWSARNQAQQRSDTLRREVDQASSKVRELQSKVSSSRSRLRSIFDFEIPNRNQIIQSAQNEIPRQERALSSARKELSSAQSEYAQFKTRTDYDRVKNEYVQAESSLNAINKQIEKATEEIATAERRSQRLDRARPDLVKGVERRQGVADQKKAKLDEVQGRMTEFKQQEAQLVHAVESLLQQFDLNRGLYKTIIASLLSA